MKHNKQLLILLLSFLMSCGGNKPNDNNQQKEKESEKTTTEQTKQNDATASSDAKEAFVTARSGLTLRESPDQKSKILTVVPLNASVNILEKGEEGSVKDLKSNWYKVRFGKTEGYCFGAYLSFDKKIAAPETKPKKSEEGSADLSNVVDRALVNTQSGLTLREKPSKDAKSILVVPNHKEVGILEFTEVNDVIDQVTGNWCKVKFGGKEGFIFSAFLNFSKALVIAKSGLTLRKEPSKSGQQITVIPMNEEVYILNEQGMEFQEADENGFFWMKIHYKGKEGYAYSEFLQIEGC